MDFITLREFRAQAGKIWGKLAKTRELVVTRNGKPFALLTETTPTSLNDDPENPHGTRFGRALNAIRVEAKTRGLNKLSFDEVNKIIREARKSRNAAVN